jgi:hypothetical protein
VLQHLTFLTPFLSAASKSTLIFYAVWVECTLPHSRVSTSSNLQRFCVRVEWVKVRVRVRFGDGVRAELRVGAGVGARVNFKSQG